MPRFDEISGIVIYVYMRDHNPPHFHARYAGQWALFRISDGSLLKGSLPSTQLHHVREWFPSNKALLEAKWNELNP